MGFVLFCLTLLLSLLPAVATTDSNKLQPENKVNNAKVQVVSVLGTKIYLPTPIPNQSNADPSRIKTPLPPVTETPTPTPTPIDPTITSTPTLSPTPKPEPTIDPIPIPIDPPCDPYPWPPYPIEEKTTNFRIMPPVCLN